MQWEGKGKAVLLNEREAIEKAFHALGYYREEEKKKEEGDKTWLVWVGLALLVAQSR